MFNYFRKYFVRLISLTTNFLTKKDVNEISINRSNIELKKLIYKLPSRKKNRSFYASHTRIYTLHDAYLPLKTLN